MAAASRTLTPRVSVRKIPPQQQHAITTGVKLPHDMRCQYPSKFCNNAKALKTKGGMHKFCEFHRRKANLNQKRWQERRRTVREQRNGTLRPIARNEMDSKTTAKESAPTTSLSKRTKGVALSPVDVIDVFSVDVIDTFAINQFTTTTPSLAIDSPMRAQLAPTRLIHGFDNGNGTAGDFLLDDDLDLLTMLLFNDSHANVNSLYNLHLDPTIAPFRNSSTYTLSGLSTAIV